MLIDEAVEEGKCFASCLGFRMEPLLLKTKPSGSEASDIERLPRSHRLLTGLYLHGKVLHLCRDWSDHQRADISIIIIITRVPIVTTWLP